MALDSSPLHHRTQINRDAVLARIFLDWRILVLRKIKDRDLLKMRFRSWKHLSNAKVQLRWRLMIRAEVHYTHTEYLKYWCLWQHLLIIEARLRECKRKQNHCSLQRAFKTVKQAAEASKSRKNMQMVAFDALKTALEQRFFSFWKLQTSFFHQGILKQFELKNMSKFVKIWRSCRIRNDLTLSADRFFDKSVQSMFYRKWRLIFYLNYIELAKFRATRNIAILSDVFSKWVIIRKGYLRMELSEYSAILKLSNVRLASAFRYWRKGI